MIRQRVGSRVLFTIKSSTISSLLFLIFHFHMIVGLYLFNLIHTHIGLYTTVGEILLLPPKYEIIMVLSNHSFFSIAPCKVITLNPLCILFGGINSLLLFLMALFLKLSLFLALKGDSEKITVTFR